MATNFIQSLLAEPNKRLLLVQINTAENTPDDRTLLAVDAYAHLRALVDENTRLRDALVVARDRANELGERLNDAGGADVNRGQFNTMVDAALEGNDG